VTYLLFSYHVFLLWFVRKCQRNLTLAFHKINLKFGINKFSKKNIILDIFEDGEEDQEQAQGLIVSPLPLS
jgi:hypothetical protein